MTEQELLDAPRFHLIGEINELRSEVKKWQGRYKELYDKGYPDQKLKIKALDQKLADLQNYVMVPLDKHDYYESIEQKLAEAEDLVFDLQKQVIPELDEKLKVAVEALDTISKYGKSDGICAYGCDTPSVACEALAKINAE